MTIDEDSPIWQAIDTGGGQVCDIAGVLHELDKAGYGIVPKSFAMDVLRTFRMIIETTTDLDEIAAKLKPLVLDKQYDSIWESATRCGWCGKVHEVGSCEWVDVDFGRPVPLEEL